jgi:hypothetical protein
MQEAQVIITPEHAVAVWDCLSNNYGSTVHSKDDSDFMKSIGWALNLMEVMDKEVFLKEYSTTIFSHIYIPFEIGKDDKKDPWSQIVNGVHEHVHVLQCKQEGHLAYAGEYLASKDGRARFEAQAFATALELNWWKDKTLPDIERLSRKLLHYGCGQDQVNFVKGYLKMHSVTVQEGGTINDVTRNAIWMMESM